MKISKFDPSRPNIETPLDMRSRYEPHIGSPDMVVQYGAHIETPYRDPPDIWDQRLQFFVSWSLGSLIASRVIHKVFGGPTSIRFALW